MSGIPRGRLDESDLAPGSVEGNHRGRGDRAANLVDVVRPQNGGGRFRICVSRGCCSAITNAGSTGRTAVEIVESDDIGLRGATSRIHRKYDEIVGAVWRRCDIEPELGRVHRRCRSGGPEINTPIPVHGRVNAIREAMWRTAATESQDGEGLALLGFALFDFAPAEYCSGVAAGSL